MSMLLSAPLRRAARALPLSVRSLFRTLWLKARTHQETTPGGWTVRLREYNEPQHPGLLSFITTVWNTDPAYLQPLAASVFEQEGGTKFEWFILDNGSTDPRTRAALERIGAHPCVRLERVEENLGIIGGMKYCLDRASGRYVLPLDSDDLLSLDCVRIMTTAIVENNYPPLLYSDEDKLRGQEHVLPYFKPDWDPVLFLHSCYIAHLCALDRILALECGCYTDAAAEGSHDWDSFTRFHLARHTPVHVPEVIYSWRMHENSTSENIASKPVVYSSHQAVISRFLSGGAKPDLYSVAESPLFGGMPDWRIQRRREAAAPLTTVVLVDSPTAPLPELPTNGYAPHEIVSVSRAEGLAGLARALRGVEGLVHILPQDVQVRDPEWAWEALTLMELFPDTVTVGGRIVGRNGLLLHASGCFGFGRGCDPPDRGRPLTDPGYFAIAWKPHSASAVSAQHAVFRADFLTPLVERLARNGKASLPFLGAWAGAAARRANLRTVYSPFLIASCSTDWEAEVSDDERAAFLLAHAELMPEESLLSRHVGFSPAAPHVWTPAAKRDAHLRGLLGWAQAVASS
ncbi:glycosyltransferase [Phenylobacterium sp. LjRoot225]|uniref:glycosyltransferase n=1 Tax=Phenylobacterium sp. LjRoot225 TaxID=3342285 RepID=UPI003ECE3212